MGCFAFPLAMSWNGMLLDRWSNRIRIFLITMVHGTGADNTLIPNARDRLSEELDAKMAEDLSGKFVQILKDSGTREEALCALPRAFRYPSVSEQTCH